jgi:Leucine-rich repeat (LRR) protein
VALDVSGDSQPSAAATPVKVEKNVRRWYRLRWRVLLLIPLALLLVAAVYVPRQMRQARAMAALKELNVVVRTQPTSLLGAELLLPQQYADEIVEVYWRDPALDERHLASLAGLSSIEKLELSGSNVTSQGLAHLAGLSKLYMLHLDDTQVTDDGLAALTRFRGLAVLSLDHTRVTDAGLAQLEKMPQLERLYLNGAAITDAGLPHLAKLTSLKELSLVGTQITDAGLAHLKALNNLELLKIHDTRVTQRGLDDLHVALPKCVIWLPTP